jgi:Fic family protein
MRARANAGWATWRRRRAAILVQSAMFNMLMAALRNVAIHPFLDGNGRVGRLLITLFLVERGILPPPLYLVAFFEATRADYYARLAAVSTSAAWGDWLEYFLNGVARMWWRS